MYNPASELEMPRLVGKWLPRPLSEQEAESVLSLADVSRPIGLRDRAILEVLYSTGIRRTELVRLSRYDLDLAQGTVMIREGKGKKDRVVPLGDRASAWLEKYLEEARPQLVSEPDEGIVFVSATGQLLHPIYLSYLVRRYIEAAGISKRGACHLFRHTMATVMLEHGADVRYIQEMLGHTQLSTTQVYTGVSIRKLKEVHRATHPAAKLERKRRETQETDHE
jgi:integrase/recombinase XerD